MSEKFKILIVEDDPDVLRATSRVLTKAGYDVESAEYGQEGLAKMRENMPDLLLLDAVLPDYDGFELCKTIKSTPGFSDMFVIMVSGKRVTPDEQANGLNLGADGYIVRPFSNNEFLARIEAYSRIKRSEQALRQSEERLRLCLNAANCGLWERNYGHKPDYLSSSMYTMLGYGAEDSNEVLDFFERLVHPDDQTIYLSSFDYILRPENNTIHRELRMKSNRGIWKHVLLKIDCVERDSDQKPARATGYIVDISEHKSAEEKQQRIRQLEVVGQLIGLMAHELNNAFFIINGNCELILQEKMFTPDFRENIHEIKQTVDKSASLIRELVAYAQKQIYRPKELHLDQFIDALHEKIGKIIGADIALRICLKPECNMIVFDESQLEEVFLNIVENACNAMPKGGILTIQSDPVDIEDERAKRFEIAEGEYVQLSFSDTGIGMDTEETGRIFEPFYSSKPFGEARGLGLAVVQGIVQQNGGAVTVESELGKGTTFFIFLPMKLGSEVDN